MLKRIISLALILVFNFFMFSQKDEISLVSWNIKDFGKTKNQEELNDIANIVQNADIVAIQEVVAGYGGAQAVAKLSEALNRKGSKWDYAISDPTNSPKYVTERYAFLWKTSRIKIKNRGWLITGLDSAIDREPFLLNFYIRDKKVAIINFHSRPYNRDPESEIKALTRYIIDFLKIPLIIAGDFNMDERKPVFDSLKSIGYSPAITNQKTTLKKACKRVNYLNYPIDNIFYSKDLIKAQGRVIDFVKFCDRLEQARKLSDHLPVFLSFKVE